ncbi:hypothetical protein FLL45_12160 [Aliikangiella marina]|uniref:Uncharacterized protein n=1 Tax=Aliikangiella marina TaxID=1712262 RepID=A0A545T8T3_9GAMM|nr:hypothetical protein [Aliikangiella marina]TQV73621.1 hypothetical protein FLL45_12160 [Aliikangiella marina]
MQIIGLRLLTLSVLILAELMFIQRGAIAAESSVNQSQHHAKQAHFRHIMFRETPFSKYKGIHPIENELAAQVAHYLFTYDKLGRVTSIEHKIGDQIIGNNGNWDSFIWFAPKVTISYSASGEVHRYFDEDNRQISAHGKVYEARYQYDEDGKRKALHFFDDQGKATESEWAITRYQWAEDEKGRVIEKRFNLAGELQGVRPWFRFYETRMTFDKDGVLEFMYNYGHEGKPANNDSGAGIDRIVYDRDGNFVRWQVYDKDHQPVEGNRPGVHIGEHLYDNFGNKVGIRGFDRYGKQVDFAWGNYESVNTYDSFGNLVTAQSLDGQGQQLNRVETVFSDDGTLRLLVKFVDTKGNPLVNQHWNGAAGFKFEYAKGSRRASNRIALDTNLEPKDAS